MRTMKRAQIQGEVFLYVLAAIVFSLIVIFGYDAISRLIKTANDVEMEKFKSSVISDMKNSVSNFDSYRKNAYSVPAGYTEVCFVDSTLIGSTIGGSNTIKKYPIIQDSVETGINKNVFLSPDGSQGFDAGPIQVSNSDRFLCLPVLAGRITLLRHGLGNRTEISEWTEES